MTTTTRHNRYNGKIVDKAQKRRALTKFVQTTLIKNKYEHNYQDIYLQCAHAQNCTN